MERESEPYLVHANVVAVVHEEMNVGWRTIGTGIFFFLG